MSTSNSFQRTAAWAAIVSAPLAIASLILPFMAVDFNPKAFTDIGIFLRSGPSGAALSRWGLILDIFGFYLLIVPLVLVLWRWLKPKDPDGVGLYARCLLAYSLIGAIGASILAAVLPTLIVRYASNPEQAPLLETLYGAFSDMVYVGLWNILEEFIAGVGWIGIGLLLRRERRAAGWVTIVLGVTALLDSLGVIFGLSAISETALYLYFILAPVWALWLGIDLLRNPAQLEAA